MDKYSALFARGGLSLERLRTLCQVAEAGSLTAAAGGEASRVSLYSRQLKELESFFSTRLVRRRGQRLALTEDGAALAQIANRQFIELADFTRRSRGGVAEIALGAGASVTEWLLLPRLPELRKTLRKAKFTLVRERSEKLAERLAGLRLDLAILRENAVTPSLKSRPFASLGCTLFVPRQLAGPPRTLLRWLPRVPMVAPSAGWMREQIDTAAARAGVKLRIHVDGASASLAIRGVRAGSYAAILPTLAESELADADVVALHPAFLRGLERRLCLAWHPRMTEARPIVLEAVEALAGLGA